MAGVTLTAYQPLRLVYAFHQAAERWILRRFAQAVTVDADGEARLGGYAEAAIDIFRDPRARRAPATDKGQESASRCVVYSTTNLRTLDSSDPDNPRATDVLFDAAGVTGVPGSAWVVAEVRGWRDALGWEVVLIRQGQRGFAPWV